MVGTGAEVGLWILLGASDKLRLLGRKMELVLPRLKLAGCTCSPE